MNKTLLKIINSREDLSSYLFYFTKGQNAKDTLEKITSQQEIKDITSQGYICFTEAPLLSLVEMFKIFDEFSKPMYSPYGIALKKEELFKLGGRPVIYGLPEEKKYIGDEIKWRFEPYKPNEYDFTWLREWRVPQSEISIDIDNCFIITKQKIELEKLMFNGDITTDIQFDSCVSDGLQWVNAYEIIKRSFKGISIEDLHELANLAKSEIDKKIEEQNNYDRNEIGLGGFVM